MAEVTWRALQTSAVALHENGKTREARRVAEAAVSAAGTDDERDESRLTLAWVCHQLGDRARSAQLVLDVRDLRADCLRGLLLCHDGNHAAAIPVLEAAIADPELDLRWQANALVGLGVSAIFLRKFTMADEALERAYEIYRGLGELERAATCKHNQGFAAAEAGDLPRALELYDAAAIDETRRPEVLVDRAKALLDCGLLREAGVALTRAGRLLGAAGRGPAYADAMLTYGWCCLRAGNPAAARTAASMIDLPEASALDAHARIAVGEAVDIDAIAEMCDPAVAARLRLAAAKPELVALERFSRHPQLRALGWLAQAQLAETRGAVLAACRAGLRSNPRSVELAQTGRSAVTSPRAVFAWIERERAALDNTDRLPTATEVVEALGDNSLLSFYIHNGLTSAVAIIGGRFTTHELGQVDLAAVRAALTLVATTNQGQVAAGHALRALDEQIFSKIDLPHRPVVILTRDLHQIPWSALPSLQDVPVTTAPSAAHWLDAEGPVPEGHLWVAGPRLKHAETEARALHREHGGVLLTGNNATVDAVRAAMAEAGTAHIAAHCVHKPRAPLFSALELADGPLFGHHIARLGRLPARVVLSACESALDLPRVFLDNGTRSIVASTLPVADERVSELVTDLHRRLALGADTASALAGAHPGLGFVVIGR
ncbi:CHAT domain-containing protein [Actinokineospora terrae]|uniref:CHAT domain-containing protein n=1 Tax=Actinokineospora terrae TaxID=155974 RepID=UPI000B867183|nr:CHAT domain-containing protein [Actinokineospora terrae]